MARSTRPVAWVTGASRGLGPDVARSLARAGYDVALTSRDQRRLNEVATAIEPGFVAYGDSLEASIRKYPGVPVSPPEAIGPAVVWLAQAPDAIRLVRKRVSLPDITHKHGLLPDWDGPGTHYPKTA